MTLITKVRNEKVAPFFFNRLFFHGIYLFKAFIKLRKKGQLKELNQQPWKTKS